MHAAPATRHAGTTPRGHRRELAVVAGPLETRSGHHHGGYGVGSATMAPRMSLLPKVAGHEPRTFGAGSGLLVYSDAR